MSRTRVTLRTASVAARALLVLTVVLGLGYTGLILAVGQVALPAQANGSLVRDAAGTVVGSSLLGQSWTDADGTARPEYFQSRPSAAGDGYDGRSSSGSNLGPSNENLVAAIEDRRATAAELDGVAPEDVSVDALTASGSGLDPDISLAYAAQQVDRVAAARAIDPGVVRELLAEHTIGRDLGFLGEPRVNVLALNLALDGR